MNIESILSNNKIWAKSKLDENKDFFKNLSKKQKPKVLYIGCSDSRVSTEELMGAKFGEVFVHRNIGNMVTSIDLNVMSVVNYAINQLKIRQIVVCGHYDCGGINAAMEPSDMGILNPWLRNIRDVYRLHQKTLSKIEDNELRNRRLVELNVEEQCINLIKTAAVQKAYVKNGIRVHGLVFDLKTGELKDLNINFTKIVEKIQEIYRLI